MRSMLGIAAIGLGAIAGADDTVTFDDGPEGWSINGWDTPDPFGGNPGASLRWADFIDTFGLEIRNSTNPAFVTDYAALGPVRLSIDVDVTYIEFFGTPVGRELVLELRDYDNVGTPAPYVSVWFNVGVLQAPEDGWATYAVEICDPLASDLPPGWGGTGDETALAEPILPDDRTFTDVLAGVDEIVWTTFVPGFFFGFTHFDLTVDNIAVVSLECDADIAEPFGTLDFFDVLAYLALFDAEDPGADIAAPLGVWDFFDVLAYLALFDAGCP